MVIFDSKSCSHGTCTKRPILNVEGSKTGVVWQQHADDGMVDVVYKRCLRDPCTGRATCGLKDSNVALVCKWHGGRRQQVLLI
ncbi:unnamed protein product [Laminaria digitata]